MARSWIGLACALWFVACSDDANDAAPQSGHADAGADASATSGDLESTPVPMSSGQNVSFDTAWPMDTAGLGVLQDVRSATQVDYFSFEAKAGAFYEIATGRRSFGPDNTLTLYDPDRIPIAENDDGPRFPGDAIDARLIVRTARSGRYFVRVEDPYTPSQVFSDPSYPLLYYRFWVRALTRRVAGTAQAETGAKPTSVEFVHDDASGYECATVFGELADGEDQVYSVSGRTDYALIGHVHEPGAHGDGSSAAGGVITVSDAADHHALAQIDRDSGQASIHPPVSEGAYEVRVAGRGDPGPNGFYALDLVLLPDNPRERDDVTNGTPEGAETIDMPGTPQRRGLLLSTLPGDDVDYYQFDALANDAITVACEGASGGSGVRRLRAELRDASGATLLAGVETTRENLQLDGLEITHPQKLFLRLSHESPAAHDGEDEREIEPWTRCVVIAGP